MVCRRVYYHRKRVCCLQFYKRNGEKGEKREKTRIPSLASLHNPTKLKTTNRPHMGDTHYNMSFTITYPHLGIDHAHVLHTRIDCERGPWLSWGWDDTAKDLEQFLRTDIILAEMGGLENAVEKLLYTFGKVIYSIPEDPDYLYVICCEFDKTPTSYSQEANHGRTVVRTEQLSFPEEPNKTVLILNVNEEKHSLLINTSYSYPGEQVQWFKAKRLDPIPPCVATSPTLFFQQMEHLIRSVIALRTKNQYANGRYYPWNEVHDMKLENTGWCPESQSLRMFDIDYSCTTTQYETGRLFGCRGSTMSKDIRTIVGCMMYYLGQNDGTTSFPCKWTSFDDVVSILTRAQYPPFWKTILQGLLLELQKPIVLFQHVRKYYLDDEDHAIDTRIYDERCIQWIERGLMTHEDKVREDIPPPRMPSVVQIDMRMRVSLRGYMRAAWLALSSNRNPHPYFLPKLT